MAMHKELQVNTFITCFPKIESVAYIDRYRNEEGRMVHVRTEKNVVEIYALYVYNRRARTNGVQVPADLVPFLKSLNIRINERRAGRGRFLYWAIGCTTYPLGRYELVNNHTIPSLAIEKMSNFKNYMPQTITYSDYVTRKLSRFSNTHKTFCLYPPAYELIGISHIKKVTELPEVDTWI